MLKTVFPYRQTTKLLSTVMLLAVLNTQSPQGLQPAENCEFGANTIFTINGISMNASPVENGDYELTYTFTAHEVQSYVVIVNGEESQKHEEGDTVDISTPASDFYKWTAEVVYETTETIIGENDNTETKTVTHRNPISIFADGGEYKAKTSFVMPKLADGSRLELTANKAHGIIAYDKQTMTADIVADKAYNGKTVIVAAYSDGKLVSVEYVNKNLTEGFNAATAPEAFSITGADTIKVMVWENFDNMKPLFKDFEKQITGDGNKMKNKTRGTISLCLRNNLRIVRSVVYNTEFSI